MNGGRWTGIAGAVVVTAVVASLATCGQAATADLGEQIATPTKTTPRGLATKHPAGVVLDCSTQLATGGGLSNFENPSNLVVGPLAILGARDRPGFTTASDAHKFPPLSDKFPLYVKAGHRVTLALSRPTRRGAAIAYGPAPASTVRDGYRVVTFIACQRGEYSQSAASPAGPVSLWAGGIIANSPRCVPLLIWVDHDARPRRAMISLGVRNCG
jgi:hypothetical protein